MKDQTTDATRRSLLVRAWSQRSGASYVEVAIAIPFFIVALIGFIDLCRYWAVRTVAQYGVNAGASLAAKIDGITIDDRFFSDPPTPEEQAELVRMVEARNAIIAEASKVALGILIRPHDVGGIAKSVPFDVQYGKYDGSSISSDSKNIIVLRPGDIFKRTYSDTYYSHMSNCGSPKICEFQCPEPEPSDKDHCYFNVSYPGLFKLFPIELYYEIQFSWLIPFIPDSTIKVHAFAYRERTWDGAVTEAMDGGLELFATPTPTFVPTFTPGPTATPSATKTPLPSPTPTATGTLPTMTPTNSPQPTSTINLTPSSTPVDTATPLNTFTPSVTPTSEIGF